MATHSSTLAWKVAWTDGEAWQATVHGVAESRARLSNFTFTFCPHLLTQSLLVPVVDTLTINVNLGNIVKNEVNENISNLTSY